MEETFNKSKNGNLLSNTFFVTHEFQRLALHQEIYDNLPLSAFDCLSSQYNVNCTSLAPDTYETIQKKIDLPQEVMNQSFIYDGTCRFNWEIMKAILVDAISEVEKIEGKVFFSKLPNAKR